VINPDRSIVEGTYRSEVRLRHVIEELDELDNAALRKQAEVKTGGDACHGAMSKQSLCHSMLDVRVPWPAPVPI
jgi:hypothetical protein